MVRKRTAVLIVLLAALFFASVPSSVSAGDETRFGFGANSFADGYNTGVLGAGWYHAWRPRLPYSLPGLDFYPMVGAYGDLMGNETETTIRAAIRDMPANYPDGTVWIISNELEHDIFTTKNGIPLNPPRAITPVEYAEKYKKYRDILKSINPTFQTAIGFILSIEEAGRLYTLTDFTDAIKAKYNGQLPIDVYNLHTYAFGRSIDFDITFKGVVNHYRQTMATIGVRDKPLIITELGVLVGVYTDYIPESYVLDFETRAFDWLRDARSDTYGMPGDDNRLVQRWAWFALTAWDPTDDHRWDETALFNIDTAQITALGQNYADYVSNMVYHTENISLQKGWNLVSVPVELQSYAPADVLSSISGSYDVVYAWDAVNDAWKSYTVGGPSGGNTLTSLDPYAGFWVHTTRSATLKLTGEVRNSASIPVYTGWNLIAYPLLDGKPIADALSSISGKYSSVYAYDAAQPADPWRKYLPGKPAYVSDLTQMQSGKGYWILATKNCTLTLP